MLNDSLAGCGGYYSQLRKPKPSSERRTLSRGTSESSRSTERRASNPVTIPNPIATASNPVTRNVRKLPLHRASSVEPCHAESSDPAPAERRTLSRSASNRVTLSVEACHVQRRTLSHKARKSRGNKGGFQPTTEKQGIRVQIPCFHSPGTRAPWKRARSPGADTTELARRLVQIIALVGQGRQRGGPEHKHGARITSTPARVLVDRRSLIGRRSQCGRPRRLLVTAANVSGSVGVMPKRMLSTMRVAAAAASSPHSRAGGGEQGRPAGIRA